MGEKNKVAESEKFFSTVIESFALFFFWGGGGIGGGGYIKDVFLLNFNRHFDTSFCPFFFFLAFSCNLYILSLFCFGKKNGELFFFLFQISEEKRI